MYSKCTKYTQYILYVQYAHQDQVENSINTNYVHKIYVLYRIVLVS